MLPQNTALFSKTLQQAINNRDVNLLLSLYADDAELCIIDDNHPQKEPVWMRGREAIAQHYDRLFSKPVSHRVDSQVIGDDQVAYTEACEFADGRRALLSATIELKDGYIYREVDVLKSPPN